VAGPGTRQSRTTLSLTTLALSMAVILGACGGGETEASPTSIAATTSSAPTTTTTLATTTTLSDQEVLEVFLRLITSPSFMGRAEMVMDISAGPIAVTATGTIEFDGDDSYTVVEIPGLPIEESIDFAGSEYEKAGDGPWVRTDPVADPFAEPDAGPEAAVEDIEFIAAMQTLGELEHQAVVEQDGLVLHRIGLPAGVEADPVGFGLDPENNTLELVFLAAADGTPYEMSMVVVDSSDPDLTLTMDIEIRFTEIGTVVDIAAPDNPWLRHTSDDLSYSIAYPHGWDREEYREEALYAEDVFYGLNNEVLDLYVNFIDPPEPVSLNAWMSSFRTEVGAEPGITMGEAETFEVAGFPARLVSYTGEDEAGTFFAIYAVSQTDPATVYEFIFFGDSEPELGGLFDDFVSTFQPAA